MYRLCTFVLPVGIYGRDFGFSLQARAREQQDLGRFAELSCHSSKNSRACSKEVDHLTLPQGIKVYRVSINLA